MDKAKAMIATVLLNGIIWVTVGIVTTQAIKTTGRGEWGWLMLIPALSSFSYTSERKTDNNK